MTADFGVMDHSLEVAIEAPPSRVWKALTDQATSWWHPGFLSQKGALAFRIEPELGGRAFEDLGDGQGVTWYTVTGLVRNELLQLSGDLDVQHGPARILTTFRLRRDGERTVLRLEEAVFGRVTERTKSSLAAGWRVLLEGCLKVFVETGAAPPAWPSMEGC